MVTLCDECGCEAVESHALPGEEFPGAWVVCTDCVPLDSVDAGGVAEALKRLQKEKQDGDETW